MWWLCTEKCAYKLYWTTPCRNVILPCPRQTTVTYFITRPAAKSADRKKCNSILHSFPNSNIVSAVYTDFSRCGNCWIKWHSIFQENNFALQTVSFVYYSRNFKTDWKLNELCLHCLAFFYLPQKAWGEKNFRICK